MGNDFSQTKEADTKDSVSSPPSYLPNEYIPSPISTFLASHPLPPKAAEERKEFFKKKE